LQKTWFRGGLAAFLPGRQFRLEKVHSGGEAKHNIRGKKSRKPPPMGDRLGVAVGLMGSEDPADSAF